MPLIIIQHLRFNFLCDIYFWDININLNFYLLVQLLFDKLNTLIIINFE